MALGAAVTLGLGEGVVLGLGLGKPIKVDSGVGVGKGEAVLAGLGEGEPVGVSGLPRKSIKPIKAKTTRAMINATVVFRLIIIS